jgi:hypothetical protein
MAGERHGRGMLCVNRLLKYGEFVQQPIDYKRLFHGAIQFPLQRRLTELRSDQPAVTKAQNSLKYPSVFLLLHMGKDLSLHPRL